MGKKASRTKQTEAEKSAVQVEEKQ